MMSNNRADYSSAAEWLSTLRQDGLWLSQLQQLQNPSANRDALREAAFRKIGQKTVFEYWDSYQHQVEPTVTEVWEAAELSLVTLKMQTIGMLSMEWLEQQEGTNQGLHAEDATDAIIDRLKPIFFGSEAEARAFLESIQGMKPTQITDKVNRLVDEKKISVLSSHRDLWKVLHDFNLYKRTEANWNMQVR
jgi:hypothetical protein